MGREYTHPKQKERTFLAQHQRHHVYIKDQYLYYKKSSKHMQVNNVIKTEETPLKITKGQESPKFCTSLSRMGV